MKIFNYIFGAASRQQILDDGKDWHQFMSENDKREVSPKEAMSVMFYREIAGFLMPMTAMIMGYLMAYGTYSIKASKEIDIEIPFLEFIPYVFLFFAVSLTINRMIYIYRLLIIKHILKEMN